MIKSPIRKALNLILYNIYLLFISELFALGILAILWLVLYLYAGISADHSSFVRFYIQETSHYVMLIFFTISLCVYFLLAGIALFSLFLASIHENYYPNHYQDKWNIRKHSRENGIQP